MKRALTLFLCLALIIGCSSLATVAAAVPNPTDLLEVWNMDSVPTGVSLGSASDASGWATKGSGDNTYNVYGVSGFGFDGTGALLYDNLSADWRDVVWFNYTKDRSAISDWSGATEIWFWVDASRWQGSNLLMDINFVDANDQLWKTNRQNCTTGTYYYQSSGSWTTKTLNDWGHMALPKTYVGWVRIQLDKNAFLVDGNPSATMALKGVKKIGFYVEGGTVGAKMYIDSVRLKDATYQPPQSNGLINQDVAKTNAWTVAADTNTTYQKVKSFGASGCWWSDDMANWPIIDEVVELLYGTEYGIGLNAYRYNLGAGSRGDSAVDPWRQTDCVLKPDGSIDLSLDAGALSVLQKVIAKGATDITVFVNSPPVSMTQNGRALANASTFTPSSAGSNLKSDQYDAFAKFVVDASQAIYDKYIKGTGVTDYFLSPINEPEWEWDLTHTNQEGCHYGWDAAWTVTQKVLAELKNQNAAAKLSALDTPYWTSQYLYNIYANLVDSTIQNNYGQWIGNVATHEYGDYNKNTAKTQLTSRGYSVNSKVPIRQSEWGEAVSGSQKAGIDGGIVLAHEVWEDMTLLNCESWSYWTAVSQYNYSDGLLYVNPQNTDKVTDTKRLWTLGNYSKFVANTTRIKLGSESNNNCYASAYKSDDGKTVSVVLINDTNNDRVVSLSGTGTSLAQVWLTDSTHDLVNVGVMSNDYGFVLPSMSVVTLVYDNHTNTVTFNTRGGSSVSAAQVATGALVSVPSTPTYGSHTLEGWYCNGKKWNLAADRVTAPITLYARWSGAGNVDGNSGVTIADVRLALKAAVGKTALTAEQTMLADVNFDGKLTVVDVRKLLRYVVKKISDF